MWYELVIRFRLDLFPLMGMIVLFGYLIVRTVLSIIEYDRSIKK